MRPFAGVFGVRMVNVFAVGKKFKIFQPIVGPIKVFMINFKSARNDPVKGFPNKSMNGASDINTIAAQIYRKVVFYGLRQQRPVCLVAAPSLAVLNREHGGYAGVQKSCNIRQFVSVGQHLFGDDNLFCGKFFPPCNPTYVAKIANFVHCFIPKHRSPNFHKMSPLTSYNPISNLIEGQA